MWSRFANQYVTVRRNITGRCQPTKKITDDLNFTLQSFQENGDHELEEIAAERYRKAKEQYVDDGESRIPRYDAVRDAAVLKGLNDPSELDKL